MLKVIIVDDEQPARDELKELLSIKPGIEVIAQCGNALEAIPAIHKLQPDVIFPNDPLCQNALSLALNPKHG